MNNTKLMDIIAYYLSEYDMDAVSKLGYSSRSEAFQKLGILFGKNNNYLKRLRDEYDVVTSSHRNGQCNRPPRERIINMKQHLETFTFEEVSQIVAAIIENISREQPVLVDDSSLVECNSNELSEEEIERIINFKDVSSGIKLTTGKTQKRIYNTSIIKRLKQLYKGSCQVCGCNPTAEHSINIVEVHHIEHFSVSQNNDSNNLIVLCPNHHRMIHKLNPRFDPSREAFILTNGNEIKIILDHHLFE